MHKIVKYTFPKKKIIRMFAFNKLLLKAEWYTKETTCLNIQKE